MTTRVEPESGEPVPCNLCGACRTTIWCYVKESTDPHATPVFQGSKRFPVVRCQECGLVYISPRYTPEQRREIYRDESLFTASSDPEGRKRSYLGERAIKQQAFRRLLSGLEEHVAGGRLLDVGCGPGFFLDILGEHWDGEGIEPSPFAAGYAREELGVEVRQGDFVSGAGPARAYAAVAMLQVLDHLPDPMESLREAHRLLQERGVLLLSSLVNIESFCARVFREGYRLLAPNHLYYFSPRTIRQMLAEAGFETLAIRFPYLDTPYCNPREIGRLMGRTLAATVSRLWGGPRRTVLSPPFYGNMMDVLARKVGE